MTASAAYLALWTVGCATGFVAGVWTLRARSACRPSTVFALGLAWGGLIVGAKLQSRLEFLPLQDAVDMSLAEMLTPGMRLPLGFVTGAAVALAWCILVRAPVLATGDALAVAASTLIPIGRVGCLANGCCMGSVCPSWLGWACPRYGPQSDAWHEQFRHGMVDVSQLVSLPVHPLPVYFGLASLATLGILLWLLRRGTAPGTLLATFCILRPATKLAFEPLRAPVVSDPLLTQIPVVVLTVTLLVVCAQLLPAVRRWFEPRARRNLERA
jgi:phosphatidylglycerol:prolipoprotein diacylglycerol transferase